MAPFWVLPNRYYYCNICNSYYTGRDKELTLMNREEMYRLIQENQVNVPKEPQE